MRAALAQAGRLADSSAQCEGGSGCWEAWAAGVPKNLRTDPLRFVKSGCSFLRPKRQPRARPMFSANSTGRPQYKSLWLQNRRYRALRYGCASVSA